MVVIGIVGGGIGGIALALALQQRGIETKIFEGDASFDSRRQGYGLTMQQAGQAIRELGIELKEEAPSRSHYVFSADGQVVGFFGRAFRSAECCGESEDQPDCRRKMKASRWKPAPKIRFNVHIPRQVLREMLLKRVEAGTIQWGRKLAGYSEISALGNPEVAAGAGVCLSFVDGTQESVTALVGADGIHSVVRRQKIGDALCYLGVIVVLGIVKSQHPLVHERIFETVDGTTRIYVMPFTSDCSMWQLSFPYAEDHAKSICSNPELLRKDALVRCKGWHAPVPEMLSETSLELICGYPVYDRQPLSAADARGNANSVVTLLGDAAHAMSPFRGQGANQALLDAVLLAECIGNELTKGGPANLAHAFAVYEDSMLKRSSTKVLASREAARALHSDAVHGIADKVEVGGKVLESQRIMEELRRAGVGAWTSEAEEGIDAAVRRVCGRLPSGCPSALHVDKMLRGRVHASAAAPAPKPAIHTKSRQTRPRLPVPAADEMVEAPTLRKGSQAEDDEAEWEALRLEW